MSRKHSSLLGLGTAAGAAFAAALISVGTAASAFAVPPTSTDADPFSDLYGSENAGDPSSIGGHDAALDTSLSQDNLGNFPQAFDTNVDEFESTQDHPFADLVNAFDPHAFITQTDPDIMGTLPGGEYLVPTDSFGYFATDLDYFLTGTGATFLLNPAVDALLFLNPIPF
jgi:hypothetical protein